MTREQLRNEKCRCGSGLKFKNCCGKFSNQLYHDWPDSVRQQKDSEIRKHYNLYKSIPIRLSNESDYPNTQNLDIVKEILKYWESDEFNKTVFEIEGRFIDEHKMLRKREELLKSTEGVKMHIEMRFWSLHTPYFQVMAYYIPKEFYKNPMLITSYELYADPVSMELRTYGSPYQIADAIKAAKGC